MQASSGACRELISNHNLVYICSPRRGGTDRSGLGHPLTVGRGSAACEACGRRSCPFSSAHAQQTATGRSARVQMCVPRRVVDLLCAQPFVFSFLTSTDGMRAGTHTTFGMAASARAPACVRQCPRRHGSATARPRPCVSGTGV